MSEKHISRLPRRPTNPAYTGEPHPDPRVHGTEICPHRCGMCSDGLHHWIENGFDPEDEYYGSDDDPDSELHDAIRNAGHAEFHYVCKHCQTWAETEFIEDQDEEGNEK